MAEVFSKHNKDKAIYTVSAGWLYWDEKKWEVSELKVMHLYMETAKKVLKNATYEFREAYTKLMQAEMDGAKDVIAKAKSEANKAKQYLTFAKKMNDHGKVSGILKLGKSMLEVANDNLDSDPFILNTPDGIVDLKTGKMNEHKPSAYCTKMTFVSPANDNMHLWIETLDEVTGGDKEFQNFLKYHAGSTLIGRVYEEALLLVYGSGGNGKSTVFNSEAHVLGDYAGKIPAESLTTRAKNVKVDLAELCGKRYILASETEKGQRLSVSMLKQIASVDDIYLQKENIMHRFLLLQVIQPFFIRTIYLKLVQMIEVHGIKVSEIDKVRKAGVTAYAGLSTGKDEHRSSN
jgi:Predicted ATPase